MTKGYSRYWKRIMYAQGEDKIGRYKVIRRIAPEEWILSWPKWKQNLLWRIGYLLTKLGLSRQIALIPQGFLLFGVLSMISKKKIVLDFPGSGGTINFMLWSLW